MFWKCFLFFLLSFFFLKIQEDFFFKLLHKNDPKWYFCDAPLNFTVFDLKFKRSKHLPTHLYTKHDVFPALFGACIDQSGTVTLLSAPVGACCHLHLASYLSQYTSRWPLLSKNSRRLLDTRTLHHGMPDWAVQR